jgi:small-conductance mechanosensitive channel
VELLETVYAGNTLYAWIVAIAIATISILLLVAIRGFVRRRLAAVRETEGEFQAFYLDLVEKTSIVLLSIPIVVAAFRTLNLPNNIIVFGRHAAIVAFLLQMGIWLTDFAQFWLDRYRRARLETDQAAVTTITAVSFLAKIAIWAVILLLGMQNFGIQVTALIAGLGIGGIAIALATQNILSDLFASLSIVIDKPFVIGDFIVVGDLAGSVEHVGLKTTRVRSLSGEQLVFSNSDLLGSRIRNFKRLIERRIVFHFGVTYQTTREQLEAIPVIVREIIESQSKVRFDRSHFQKFGDSSLDFESVYHVLVPEMAAAMDVQQRINLDLVSRFAELGIDFAYPTRPLHIEKQ